MAATSSEESSISSVSSEFLMRLTLLPNEAGNTMAMFCLGFLEDGGQISFEGSLSAVSTKHFPCRTVNRPQLDCILVVREFSKG